MPVVLNGGQPVPRGGHGAGQRVAFHAGRNRQRRSFEGEVYVGGNDTGDLGEDLLYPRRARAAGHALDVEYTGFGIHAEIRSLGGGRHGAARGAG